MARRQEFRITLDGVDLSSDTVDRISQAIQRAALAELATVDVNGDLAARILSGPTQGIQLAVLDQQQAGQVDFGEVTE